MHAVPVNRDEALKQLLATHGLPVRHHPHEAVDSVIAEYLRRTLGALTTIDQQNDAEPVYVTTVLNAVRRQLAPLWPELYGFRDLRPSELEIVAEGDLHPDRVRKVLERLSDLRDVVELGEGYWLPSPVRLVELPGGDKALVIGGLATADLRQQFSKAVELVGLTRVISCSALPVSFRTNTKLWQPYDAWCGDPPSDILKWATTLVNRAKRDLGISASDFTDFEVYAPWLRGNQPQYFRWLRFDAFVEENRSDHYDLVLCRTLPGHLQLPRRYWLGEIRGGALRREANVGPANVRRLQYALDLSYQAPTVATLENGDTFTIRSWLPAEEQRPLFALTKDVSPQPGRFPIRLRVEPDWLDFVLGLLTGLGIRMVQR